MAKKRGKKRKHAKSRNLDRFQIVDLCGWLCLVDMMPDDPEYKRAGPRDTVIYFQKILESLPKSTENLERVRARLRELDQAWRNSPDFKRQCREASHFAKMINMITHEYITRKRRGT